MIRSEREPSSFRDPSGFLFRREGTLYRQINHIYRDDYHHLMNSGLYDVLVEKKLLVPHRKAEVQPWEPESAECVIRPEIVPFISYPYEWCFSQLKVAALLTLEVQNLAMEHGMSMKDSSAYNIQFVRGKPVLIDTLSFEMHQDGDPWTAYRQFCQHFLAPLALISYLDSRHQQLLRIHLDGIPLDLASQMLPWRTRLRIPLFLHLHLHASAQKRYAGQAVDLSSSSQKVSSTGIRGILSSLANIIEKLTWEPSGTGWADYSSTHQYSDTAYQHKKELVSHYLQDIQPDSVWDLGANTGEFSRLASKRGIQTIAFDIDPGAVELNYQECLREQDPNLLPLQIDLTNPSPGLGWENQERKSLVERGPADLVLALALVHHLALTNNLPLSKTAKYFSRLGLWLVIEFIPKHDPQAQRLLASRKDIFESYQQQSFEQDFGHHYQIIDKQVVKDSQRTLYLMKKLD